MRFGMELEAYGSKCNTWNIGWICRCEEIKKKQFSWRSLIEKDIDSLTRHMIWWSSHYRRHMWNPDTLPVIDLTLLRIRRCVATIAWSPKMKWWSDVVLDLTLLKYSNYYLNDGVSSKVFSLNLLPSINFWIIEFKPRQIKNKWMLGFNNHDEGNYTCQNTKNHMNWVKLFKTISSTK